MTDRGYRFRNEGDFRGPHLPGQDLNQGKEVTHEADGQHVRASDDSRSGSGRDPVVPGSVQAQLGSVDENGEQGRDGSAPLGQCQWFVLCPNEAKKTRSHPVLGEVPICDRCDNMIGELDRKTRS